MARARKKRDRLHQIANWLRHEYPTPYPVDLRVEKIPKDELDERHPCGDMWFGNKRFLIRIDPRQGWVSAIGTLHHEWAHCVVWTFAHIEKNRPVHPDEFWLANGRIDRHFHDEDGWEDSQEYPW